ALVDETSMGDLQGSYPQSSDDVGESKVKITSYSENRVTMDVDSARPGVAVLHDLYYPGWEARVDGEARPVLHTNILFRGVEVPAGHHVVSFEFHPLSLANLTVAAKGLLRRPEE